MTAPAPTSSLERSAALFEQALVAGDQLGQQTVEDGRLDEEAARGGATLPRGACSPEGDGACGQVEVGGLVDDDGVVATELEKNAAENAFFAKVWQSQKDFAAIAVPFWAGAQASNAALGKAFADSIKKKQ